MRSTTLAIATVAALGFTTVQAAAATLLLDTFDTLQFVGDTPSSTISSTDTIAFGSGTRTLEAVNYQNIGISETATSLASAAGSLNFSNDNGATGAGTLTYTNLGNIVLGTNPFFLFEVGEFDHIANFTVTVTDGLANVSTYTEVLSPGFDNELLYSAFTGTADFTDVASLSFMIDSENVPVFGPQSRADGELLSISISAVPLPASSLLLLGGLGGLVSMRRRKNKATA